jgi:uncharacterized membrane protein
MSPLSRRSAVRRGSLAVPLSMLLVASVAGAASGDEAPPSRYVITELGSLGGTGSGASSITDPGLVAGFSALAGDGVIHATIWESNSPTDLGTLGGPNSAVLWPNENNGGIVVGVSETAEVDANGELWSCSAFFPTETGKVCRGFVYEEGQMRGLPTHGGTHSFAAGVNDRGLVVGWAETAEPDPSCAGRGQVLGFIGAVWNTRAGDVIRPLPPLDGDSASSATAINARGQAVGISGICDQAVGRFTARRMAIWENGLPTEIASFGAGAWNTPMAISNSAVVVGFANAPGTVGGAFNERPFLWTAGGGTVDLGTLPGSTRGQALGVGERGQVVGLSRVAGLTATLWQAGQVLNINDLAVGYDGHLLYANDINAAGVITGAAVNEAGETVAFVATPID